MADESDQTLIRAYVGNRCEASFSELVHRYVDPVHSTALRIVRDSSLAEDVTQRVFLALAQHSAKLQGRSSLTGWLHETARNLAVNTVRGEERRRQREKEAASMNNYPLNEAEDLWKQIAPCLDDAIAELDSAEREVILWRYFERRTAEQIGARLGLSAEAAQKRVTRSLQRLRGIFAGRGITASTATLGAVLSTQAVQSAPIGLAASAIVAGSAVSGILPTSSIVQVIMASTNVKIGLATLLAASVTTPLVLQHQTNTRLRQEVQTLRAQLAVLPAPQVSTDNSELDRLRAEHQELMRLRGQVTQLRGQLANQAKTLSNQAKVERVKTGSGERAAFESENARELLAKSPEIPMIQVKSLVPAGYATPLASLQTMNWAAANRDTNAMFNAVGLEPEARKRADELFAQLPEATRQKYGTVDALLVDWRMNLAEPPEAYRILSQSEQDVENVLLTVQFQYPSGRVRENELSFYRDEQGAWRQAMPPQVMEKLPHVVNTEPQPSAAVGK